MAASKFSKEAAASKSKASPVGATTVSALGTASRSELRIFAFLSGWMRSPWTALSYVGRDIPIRAAACPMVSFRASLSAWTAAISRFEILVIIFWFSFQNDAQHMARKAGIASEKASKINDLTS
jgi:hypothetical protein